MPATAETTHDVVVLGGGSGGDACALRAAELGLTVALVEKGLLGGICLHRCCIPDQGPAPRGRRRLVGRHVVVGKRRLVGRHVVLAIGGRVMTSDQTLDLEEVPELSRTPTPPRTRRSAKPTWRSPGSRCTRTTRVMNATAAHEGEHH